MSGQVAFFVFTRINRILNFMADEKYHAIPC